VVVVGVGIRWYQVVVVVVVSNQISGLTDKTCFYHLRNSNMQVNGSLWSTLGSPYDQSLARQSGARGLVVRRPIAHPAILVAHIGVGYTARPWRPGSSKLSCECVVDAGNGAVAVLCRYTRELAAVPLHQ
jgi:hypothetical protein